MNPLREQFISEARELVLQATDDLIAMERSGFDLGRIEKVFRAFHTLKGSAGVVELPAMSLLLHEAEDLLMQVNTKQCPMTTEMVNALLLCLDQVSKWVDDFETRGALQANAGEVARTSAERLRGFLLPASDKSHSALPASPDIPHWASRLAATIPQLPEESRYDHLAILYEPIVGCFFNGDDPLRLIQAISNLVAMSIEPREVWPSLDELDPFACNLRIHAIARATRAEVADIFRFVPDQIQIFELPAATALDRPIESHDRPLALLENVITEQIRLLQTFQGGDFYGRIGSAARVSANALRYSGRIELSQVVDDALQTAIAQKNPSPLLTSLEVLAGQLSQTPSQSASESTSSSMTSRSLRVEEAKIDAIFNLSGEMIVAKNGLSHLAQRIVNTANDINLARDVRESIESVDRLIGDMHSAILQLRMVPVDQLFRSFPRVVRDISQRFGKKVELITRGGTTECDKHIVDRLFEPLMHLVRNALDHGIETPATRNVAGKSETATITFQASRGGDRLIIEVTDDGRGIDPENIRRKARELGALTPQEIDELSDEQVIHLIFGAGFSTASEVSDISGRGVGMDVVRNTVEQLGGRITLSSHIGTGMTVRLDLPISIAMAQIMIVDAGGQSFGLPMDAVNETVRLSPDRITQFKNNRGFVLRERIVPICNLAELMSLPPSPITQPGESTHLLVVAEVADRIAALEVDAIRGRLDAVLKPMQGVLSNARGYTGTTMTSDGRVLLVLDLKEILP